LRQSAGRVFTVSGLLFPTDFRQQGSNNIPMLLAGILRLINQQVIPLLIQPHQYPGLQIGLLQQAVAVVNQIGIVQFGLCGFKILVLRRKKCPDIPIAHFQQKSFHHWARWIR
jgi:hypothetical protein